VSVSSVPTSDVQPCGQAVCAAAVFETPFERWVFAFPVSRIASQA
jgi:hypothetical protein